MKILYTFLVLMICIGVQAQSTIGEARELNADGTLVNDGAQVNLTGVVHGVNIRPSGLQFTFIDSNGDGLGVFSGSENFGYTVAEGDEVTMSGVLGQFNGLAQISPDGLSMNSGGNDLVEALVVTELSEMTESRLVTIENVSLVDPSEWSTSGSFNFTVTNGTNDFTIRIDSDVDISGLDAPTGTFSVTGIGGQFDSEAPFFEGYQLLPRYAADIDPYVTDGNGGGNDDFPLRSIVEMINVDANGVSDSLDVECTMLGVAHGYNLRAGGLSFAIIDAQNNGINVFSNSDDFGYTLTEGDLLEVTGVIGQFNGLTQIELASVDVVSQGNDLVTPTIVTSLGEDTEASLVTLEGMTFEGEWPGDGSSFNIDITNGTNTFTIRVDSDGDLSNQAEPTGPFNVTGLGGQFDNEEPYLEGYQLFPRSLADFVPVLGVNDHLDKLAFSISPNPANEVINVATDLDVQQVTILDITGKLVKLSKSTTVNIADLKAGIYIVKVQTESGFGTKKLLVENK